MRPVIGVDFDNTIVCYDNLFRRIAGERGLLAGNVGGGKKEIRDAIRGLADGETEWQRLQAVVYGPRMAEAELIEGVRGFFEACDQHGLEVFIVSHKTEFAHFDTTGTNLRVEALRWMEGTGLLGRWGVERENVYFSATRQEKIGQIRRLGCTHFVDDLEEVFSEKCFPQRVCKILFAPSGAGALPASDVFVVRNWAQIREFVFGGSAL